MLQARTVSVVVTAILLLLLPLPGLGSEAERDLIITGAKIYPSPTMEPFVNGVVAIRNGQISDVGPKGKVKLPRGAQTLDGTGLTVVAGFWNCHVHFSEPQWQDAAHQPGDKLKAQLERMLTRYGFTTVYDTGSLLANTNALRRRIESGEVPGPRIYTAGSPLFPKNGIPIYLRNQLPELVPLLPQLDSVEQARELVRQSISDGADIIKIFTGSPIGNGEFAEMPLELVKAVTSTAHRSGKQVFAHPQTMGGVMNAVEGGVDVLVHTAPQSGVWDAALLGRMKEKNVALIATLKLWRVEMERDGAPADAAQKFLNAGIEQLRAYAGAEGQVLFGTDVGYIPDYDTSEEFEYMSRAGLDWRQILATLTAAPARRFSQWTKGYVAPGQDADLVVLAADPADDVRNFAKVKYAVRAGHIIYNSDKP